MDNRLVQLAQGPSHTVQIYRGYFINGYKFISQKYGSHLKTMNSGICVKDSCYNDHERDYYGTLTEIIEFEYLGRRNNMVLFRCDLYDTEKGTKIDLYYGLVDVNHQSRLKSSSYESFILAQQAT
ncbi:hypothetical protein AXF42_Ash012595 [Apostasia shenzhenica]|uniref:DUF4216 domain-containing protein n=1 Tax=Apostasia shenzhenica TaxID=1088818 RepID=A0A2H9ZT52_9ASPA|nr:hypothetical protein AXF42_Ash012595 [Apostasia shenzhenica]